MISLLLKISLRLAIILIIGIISTPHMVNAQQELPMYLKDRGTGTSTSLFGTYVRKGELLVYPFYEYVINNEDEYHASELGYTGDEDFFGKIIEHEALLFFAYGFTENLHVELEGALYTEATLEKASDDPSPDMPDKIKESGLGDVESQIRWRWLTENERRPELFSFFEVTFPFQEDRVLIGTQDWEFSLGSGIIKGFRWGTLTARGAILYEEEDQDTQFGEYALEYLKRLSESWRFVATVEGEEDEVSFIGEAQWHFNPHAFLKLNSGFGLTEKAEDWAPEVGILFSF